MDGTAIVLAIVALATSIGAAVIGLLKDRDKYRFDLRVRDLEHELADMKADVKTCHDERAAGQAERDTLRATNVRQQAEIDALQGEVARLKRDLAAKGVRADSTEINKG